MGWKVVAVGGGGRTFCVRVGVFKECGECRQEVDRFFGARQVGGRCGVVGQA